MRFITIILVLVLSCFHGSFLFAQDKVKENGISMNFDLTIREDDLDRGGLGFVAALGYVRYVSEDFRLVPSLEYSAYKWEQDDTFHNYVGLNLFAQYDLLDLGRYDIPVGGGLIMDFARTDGGDLRVAPVFHIYGTNRITFKSNNWSVEFLSFGLSTNFRDFAAIKVTYFRLEKKF